MNTVEPTPTKSVWQRLYDGETNFKIIQRWKIWFAISGALVLISVGALAVRGLNLGIDFTGGTVWEVPAGSAQMSDVEVLMADLGYQDVQVQEFTQTTGDRDRILRIEAESTADAPAATTDALAQTSSTMRRVRGEIAEDARPAMDAARAAFDAIEGPFAQDVPPLLSEIDDALEALADGDGEELGAAVDAVHDQVDALARLQAEERTRLGQGVTDELAQITGSPADEITVDTVGPSWGQQITEKARTALIVFMLAITLYITVRFEWKMAIATLAALFHDLIVVVGAYALFALPVTPATVVALLTMLGFSIYDGIVVFDRIDENTHLANTNTRSSYTDVANRSLSQVLMRSLNTSITTMFPILSILVIGAGVMGATTLSEFGLALLLGLVAGVYSSIYIATPMLALLKEREPEYTELRADLARLGPATPEGPEMVGAAAGTTPTTRRVSPENPAAPGSPPRPRKPRRRQ